jgi:energy-coupling factor transport system ATP-binding protein
MGLILKKLKREGVTVVVVTHDLEFAAVFGESFSMMFDGAVIAEGEGGRFFAGNNFYTTVSTDDAGNNRRMRTVEDVTCIKH